MLGGPILGLVGVTLGAGIGCAELFGEVGTWDTDAVIAAGIDHHVGGFRHVTFDAARASAVHGVKVVGGCVEFAGVTLQSKGIAGQL